MGNEADDKDPLRFPVIAPWLLSDGVECIVYPGLMLLRTPSAGIVARFGRRALRWNLGNVLVFCSYAPALDSKVIEFAGAGGDGWFSVHFEEMETAGLVAQQLKRMNSTPIVEIVSDIGTESWLTEDEIDILRRVAAGRTNAEIAVELKISPQSVKNRVLSILRTIEGKHQSSLFVSVLQRRLSLLNSEDEQ